MSIAPNSENFKSPSTPAPMTLAQQNAMSGLSFREFGELSDGQMEILVATRQETLALAMSSNFFDPKYRPFSSGLARWANLKFGSEGPLCMLCEHQFINSHDFAAMSFTMPPDHSAVMVGGICSGCAADRDNATLQAMCIERMHKSHLPLGACYKTAANRLLNMSHPRETAGVLLIHGVVSWPRWRQHAWLQLADGRVIDNTTPDKIMTAAEWQIKASPVIIAQFTREQTNKNFEKLGHWGPWYDDAQTSRAQDIIEQHRIKETARPDA